MKEYRRSGGNFPPFYPEGTLAESTPPHIAQSGHYLPMLTSLALVFGGMGMLALVGALVVSMMTLTNGVVLPGAMGLIGSSLLIPTAGFAAAGLLAAARRQLAGSTSSEPKPPKTPEETFVAGFTRYRRTEPAPVSVARDVSWMVTWMGAIVSGCAFWQPAA